MSTHPPMPTDLSALFSAPPAPDAARVRYDLFLLRPPNAPVPASAAAREQEDRAAAERARESALALAARETRGFLWQRERFHVTARALPARLRSVSGLRGVCLSGETAVGDAVMDEWVVTRLVLALSRRDPLLVARLRDTDGEFLLIEAADALPDWATPAATAGRVLVRAGRVHIHRAPAAGALADALADALAAMAAAVNAGHGSDLDGQDGAFEAGAAIQRALERKLEGETRRYLRENVHRARCLLPRRAARVLRQRPELVAPAVEAFYYREPARAGRVCSRMAALGPPARAVERRVAFSRAMFAQLRRQRFVPPRPFVAAVESPFRVLLAPAGESAARWSAADLGMKLACGLELLYAAEDAVDQFGESYRGCMDAALGEEEGEEEEEDAEDDSEALADDDEAWMAVHPDELEEQLAALGRRDDGQDGDDQDGDQGGAEELQQVAAMFGAFLGGQSGVDGVEGAAPVQLDVSSFMDILTGAGGHGDDQSEEEEEEEDGDEDDAALMEAMAEMEAELAGSTLAKSFVRAGDREGEGEDEDEDEAAGSPDEREEPRVTPETPLDLDLNLLSNLLESLASQDGQAGPVSNILGELRLPRAAGQ